MAGAGQGRGRPGHDTDVVDEAVAVEHGQSGQDIFRGQPLRRDLIDRDAQADDRFAADRVPDRGDRLAQEAETVLRAAAVAVGPQVHPRIEELGGQVAVTRHDLYAIESGIAQASSGGGVAGLDLLDERDRHRPGHDPEAFVRHGRWGERDRERPVGRLHELPAVVEDLAHDGAPVRVDGLRQPTVTGDARVFRGHEDVRGVAGAFVDTGHLDHNEAHSTGRSRRLIGDELVRHEPVRRHDRVVAGRDDPVPEGHASDPERLEETREGPVRWGRGG